MRARGRSSSAYIRGYRPYQDLWIRLATVIMFLLCVVLVASAVS